MAGTGGGGGGGFKHLVVIKFKDGVNEEEILKGLQKLVSEIDYVKSFEWGKDTDSHDALRQGHTHAFLTSFDSKEDYNSFVSHPIHVEFSATFSNAIEKIDARSTAPTNQNASCDNGR
ncbi:stress-response A/B barrel domain-containing protein At5g22580 [Carica papaya]|uniref:stress-response A/B barrel domain-containing protein At5g22580 n=1 Tax=Carica papaya TaxID=3649 RepID=UPI000B8D0A3A|nr:stress-response A/B barrel domain-containing protein At5g22580 [Carica papaya]